MTCMYTGIFCCDVLLLCIFCYTIKDVVTERHICSVLLHTHKTFSKKAGIYYGSYSLGGVTAGHYHHPGPMDQGSVHVPHHRHPFGCVDFHGGQSHRVYPHDVYGDERQGGQERQYSRVPRHPRYPRGGHRPQWCDARLWRVGGPRDKKQTCGIAPDGFAGHGHLYR